MDWLSFLFSDTVQMYAAVYLLALIRVSGIFLAAPFYSGQGVPTQIKIGLTVFLTLCTAPLYAAGGPEALARLANPLSLIVTVIAELGIGFAVGFAGAVAMGAIQTAGYLMSQDIGLTIANVIDPITSIQTSIIGQFKVALALFIFLGLDFHHLVVRIIAGSFRLIPPGALERTLGVGGGARLGEIALAQGSELFETAVRLSLPVSVTLLLVTIAMGFLARAVPEMNVFIFGFGLRIVVGMWVIILSLPVLAEVFRALFEKAAREGQATLQALAGGGG
jgi:flagellar biosynthesis protein FliR